MSILSFNNYTYLMLDTEFTIQSGKLDILMRTLFSQITQSYLISTNSNFQLELPVVPLNV